MVGDDVVRNILDGLIKKATYFTGITNIIQHMVLSADIRIKKIFEGDVKDELKQEWVEMVKLHKKFIKKYIDICSKLASEYELNKYDLIIYGLADDLKLILQSYMYDLTDLIQRLGAGKFEGIDIVIKGDDILITDIRKHKEHNERDDLKENTKYIR